MEHIECSCLSALQEVEAQIMQLQSRATTMQQCRELEADIKTLHADSAALDLLADVSYALHLAVVTASISPVNSNRGTFLLCL